MSSLKGKTFKPPVDVAEAAYQGLLLRHLYKRGGTRVGVVRANQLMNRKPISYDTIKRMRAFFLRHEKNKMTPPEEGNGMIAWLLWGGNPGQAWVNSVLEEDI